MTGPSGRVASPTELIESDWAQEQRELATDARMLPYFEALMAAYRTPLASAMAVLARSACDLVGPVHVVSVMRAGLPIGLALTKMMHDRGFEVKHDLLSFVRGDDKVLGIASHASATTVVVDGWTGSGGTLREIRRRWRGGPLVLAALIDPTGYCDFAGTYRDLLCPHALLHRTMSLGLGRLRLDPSHGVVATASNWDPSQLSEYVEHLTSAASPIETLEPSSENRGSGDVSMPINRSRERAGINECWRAFARGQLRGLVVNRRAATSFDVALLINVANVPVRYADLNAYACLGLIGETHD